MQVVSAQPKRNGVAARLTVLPSDADAGAGGPVPQHRVRLRRDALANRLDSPIRPEKFLPHLKVGTKDAYHRGVTAFVEWLSNVQSI